MTIRSARDSEARACRILLPEMFLPDQAPDLLVAVDPAPGPLSAEELLGAVAIGTVHPPGKPGLSVLVHVVPAHRRLGVGRALLEAAAIRVRENTDLLRAFQPVPASSQAARFMEACGFSGHDTILHWEIDGVTFHAGMLALRRRLEQRGRIPPGAKVERLRDAALDEVATLVATHFPVHRDNLLRGLRSTASDAFDADHSAVLTLDGVVRGALLYRWTGGVPTIEARVLHPSLRGGWANAILVEEATRYARNSGADRFRLSAEDTNADTVRLAHRANARLIRVEHHYWRRLA